MSPTAQQTAAANDDIDAVVHDLAMAQDVLPEESMRWALDNWDIAGPRFLAMLDRYADGIERTSETTNALFFAVHLFGEKKETAAFAPLCRLLSDNEATDSILYDATTVTLNGILISTFDGDLARLRRVIEAEDVDEFVRGAALEALVYLARTGAPNDTDMRAYLLHLRANMRPQKGSYVWTAWSLAAANLGYRDFTGQVDKLIRTRFVEPSSMDLSDFEEQVERTLADPTGMAGLEFDRIVPFTDAIGTLSTWYCFSEEARRDKERHAELATQATRSSIMTPHINPMRHVGRNDPCPCGSGKKYKKCCGA